MAEPRTNESRWHKGDCACHAAAMGHTFDDDLKCCNGKYTKCRRSFADHQADPQPCELAAYAPAGSLRRDAPRKAAESR